MRQSRAVIWIVAVMLAGIVWGVCGTDAKLVGIRSMLAVVVFGGVGLVGEAILLWLDLRRPIARTRAGDLRPPDGYWEVRPIAGAEGVANPVDPKFLAFRHFGPAGGGPRGEGDTPSGLAGRVLLVSLFVGRYGASWSEAEIASVLRALGRSAEWIEREAQRWGARVNVDLASTYFAADDPADPDVVVQFIPEGDHHGPFEAQADSKSIASASRAALALGFADIAELMRTVRERVSAETIVWIVHPRSAGRSLAIPPTESPVPGVALAVCYAREANFPEPLASPPFPDPTTFVHEVLHLFGATDKYQEPLSSFPQGWVSDRDVMCLYQSALPRLRVDRLTAREVGWIGEASPAMEKL
jgi:hypothetical protein